MRASRRWRWGAAVIHKGIQYIVTATAEPDVWHWRFQIGDTVRSGTTQTRLPAMAARRVQSKIDAALKALASSSLERDNT
jgi:hypothetical protein